MDVNSSYTILFYLFFFLLLECLSLSSILVFPYLEALSLILRFFFVYSTHLLEKLIFMGITISYLTVDNKILFVKIKHRKICYSSLFFKIDKYDDELLCFPSHFKQRMHTRVHAHASVSLSVCTFSFREKGAVKETFG